MMIKKTAVENNQISNRKKGITPTFVIIASKLLQAYVLFETHI